MFPVSSIQPSFNQAFHESSDSNSPGSSKTELPFEELLASARKQVNKEMPADRKGQVKQMEEMYTSLTSLGEQSKMPSNPYHSAWMANAEAGQYNCETLYNAMRRDLVRLLNRVDPQGNLALSPSVTTRNSAPRDVAGPTSGPKRVIPPHVEVEEIRVPRSTGAASVAPRHVAGSTSGPSRKADSSYEVFFISGSTGEVSVQNKPKYAPAETEAADLFKRAIPDSLQGKKEFFEHCAKYVKKYTRLAKCPKFAPKLAKRFEQLRTQLKDDRQALRTAEEARSMVASLVVRMGSAGDIGIKMYGKAPGNVPEMMDFMSRRYKEQAGAVDLTSPDALQNITMLFNMSLQEKKEACPNEKFGPTPDDLIEAAKNGQSFDTVREKMLCSFNLHNTRPRDNGWE